MLRLLVSEMAQEKWPSNRLRRGGKDDTTRYDTIRRAFAEFLALPTWIILGFLLLAIGFYFLDRAEITWLTPLRTILRTRVFANAQATSDLLSTIASGIITVTSITISLLLLALQQSAASLSSAVFDQFLRRPHNQIYFGFFVGLALYTLVTLATVDDPFNPVFGASLAFLLTVVALYLLIVLLYTTVNQTRPIEIIETIHDHTLAARIRQLDLIHKTRRTAQSDGHVCTPVTTTKRGFVTHIDIAALGAAADQQAGEVEIVLRVSIGAYLAFQDVLGTVRAQNEGAAAAIGEVVRRTIHLERQRDITVDPAYGIEQLEMVAWTSISTSKSNPQPGLLTIRSLRDILARWSVEEDKAADAQPFPVVYQDNVVEQLMDTFETLAVVSSESMQHQNFIEVVHTFALMFDRLPAPWQARTEDLILRILSALGDHVLTAQLDLALTDLIKTLTASARFETAAAVRTAQDQLRLSIGKLNSRATRVASKG
ncbi:MAG: DUF2254 domain-containing protein [Chloroflexota bacterium]|nr:DUF2254 domain-containing protein [Chloroflexota bacterium]